jgi:hypothetical protein
LPTWCGIPMKKFDSRHPGECAYSVRVQSGFWGFAAVMPPGSWAARQVIRTQLLRVLPSLSRYQRWKYQHVASVGEYGPGFHSLDLM